MTGAVKDLRRRRRGRREVRAGRRLPESRIVSIDVMDDYGMAMTRDVIAAADWILANKHLYNIRVANFSLHSAAPASVFLDPLDRAVEKLWFNGVVVVAAAGNYGVDGSASGVTFAPGNDPFVIMVGAATSTAPSGRPTTSRRPGRRGATRSTASPSPSSVPRAGTSSLRFRGTRPR